MNKLSLIEKKDELKLFSVRLPVELLKKLDAASSDRKKKNIKAWSIQSIVTEALTKYLK